MALLISECDGEFTATNKMALVTAVASLYFIPCDNCKYSPP